MGAATTSSGGSRSDFLPRPSRNRISSRHSATSNSYEPKSRFRHTTSSRADARPLIAGPPGHASADGGHDCPAGSSRGAPPSVDHVAATPSCALSAWSDHCAPVVPRHRWSARSELRLLPEQRGLTANAAPPASCRRSVFPRMTRCWPEGNMDMRETRIAIRKKPRLDGSRKNQPNALRTRRTKATSVSRRSEKGPRERALLVHP